MENVVLNKLRDSISYGIEEYKIRCASGIDRHYNDFGDILSVLDNLSKDEIKIVLESIASFINMFCEAKKILECRSAFDGDDEKARVTYDIFLKEFYLNKSYIKDTNISISYLRRLYEVVLSSYNVYTEDEDRLVPCSESSYEDIQDLSDSNESIRLDLFYRYLDFILSLNEQNASDVVITTLLSDINDVIDGMTLKELSSISNIYDIYAKYCLESDNFTQRVLVEIMKNPYSNSIRSGLGKRISEMRLKSKQYNDSKPIVVKISYFIKLKIDELTCTRKF